MVHIEVKLMMEYLQPIIKGYEGTKKKIDFFRIQRLIIILLVI